MTHRFMKRKPLKSHKYTTLPPTEEAIFALQGLESYYCLNLQEDDRARIQSEREKARKLKKSNWWQQKVSRGICHYCLEKVAPKDLTMDHQVPLARGGTSSKNNLVPSCKNCNSTKKLDTPAEILLREKRPETQEDHSSEK